MICMFAWIIYDPGLLALSAEVRFFKALGQNMVQQSLVIHGLEECGPWRYMVYSWIPKHLRYTVLDAMICMFAWIIYDPGLLALSAEVRFFKELGQNKVVCLFQG